MGSILAFKDFAGPIATIIAATVAAGTASLFAYRQSITAEQQAKTAKNKLKVDTFQMRFAVYQSAYNVAHIALFKNTADDAVQKELVEVSSKSRESVFLFPGEKSKIISELIDNCHRLIMNKNRLDQMSAGNKHYDILSDKVDNLEVSVSDLYFRLPDIFKEELSLSFFEDARRENSASSIICMLMAIIGALILLALYQSGLW